MLRACWAVGSSAPLPSPVGLSSFPSLSPNFVFGFNHVINSPGAAAHPGGAQGCVSMRGEVMFVLSQLGGLDNLQKIALGGCGLPVPVAGFSCSLAPGWVSPQCGSSSCRCCPQGMGTGTGVQWVLVQLVSVPSEGSWPALRRRGAAQECVRDPRSAHFWEQPPQEPSKPHGIASCLRQGSGGGDFPRAFPRRCINPRSPRSGWAWGRVSAP